MCNKYAGMTDISYLLKIKRALRENIIEKLDVIIIEWTEFILFVPEIRRLFPNAKIISIEEDVTFLKFYRKIKLASNIVKKMLRWVRYKKLKKIELKCLEHSDLIILNNPKDEKLLNDNGLKNTWHWSPYFNSFGDLKMKRNLTKDILFFGAMGRYENFTSCIWFINKVMPQLDEDYRFNMVGNTGVII